MKQTISAIVLLFITNIIYAQERQVSNSIFLVGDAGEPYIASSPIGKYLRSQILERGERAIVLYLGDNIYPKGLPPEGHKLRAEGEHILETQVSWVRDTKARGIFVPGNHDWQHWGRKGQEYIRNQQKWLDSLKDEHITLLPKDGCPGPIEIPINSTTILVIMDTQWFLHQWDKPGEESSCDCKTSEEVLSQLHDIFARNKSKRVIVAGHHPIYTYGEHGGVFTWKSHIFPLTDFSSKLYIPMPVIGSIYPLYRKWFGHVQDTPNPIYKQFSNGVEDIMAEFPGSVYVSGHEHALEYIYKDSTHFIVSGSGAKVEYVKKKGYARFAKPLRGFVRLDILTNGEIEVHFLEVNEDTAIEKEVFYDKISFNKTLEDIASENIDFTGKIVKVKASSLYDKAGKGKRKLLGENYRKEWGQEIEVPVFDIGKEKNGLKIVQRGGGQQTLSLRLADSTGREYVLRSIEKYPENAVPEVLRKTFAQDLVQDQISASHPYAALVIPPLADAVGIYHTNPKLVYIPDDPRFKEYQSLFGNTLALFEERPDDDWSDASYFGNSEKIISTTKVLEKLAADNDNQVDEKFVLKSRLFDIIIGDWDRHDDQWRWATIKGKKGDSYRPIPRDRDQTFFVNEGKITKIWSRKWALPKFEGFDEHVDWTPGLSFNARYFDRTFLTELTREDWLEVARDLKTALTDEAIEAAIKKWPHQIYSLHGEKIVKALKRRRDDVEKYALSLYEFLSQGVDIVGSDKRELFEIKRMPNGDADVKVFKLSREGEKGKQLYSRLFKYKETKEIRLYGLSGDDLFNINGKANRTILTRVIGGDGTDTISDRSSVRGKKTLFYDLENQGKIIEQKEVRDLTSVNPEVNFYDRKLFNYDRLAPLVYGNYNPDEGLFIGGGFIFIKNGFRKLPFATRHLVLASVAPQTFSFNFRYAVKFTELLGKWNLEVDANLRSPNYVNNFFGFGNESKFNRNIEKTPGISVNHAIQYYRYRFEEFTLETAVSRKLGDVATLKIGPALQRIEMEEPEDDEDRFIEEYAETLNYGLFEEYRSYAGLSWQVAVDRRNSPLFTTRGLQWILSGRNMTGLNNGSNSFSYYESTLSFYHSFRLPARVTFALRVGGGTNTGNYEFYQAQILDGKTEMRGYRKTRFYGDSKLYSNLEMRMKLLSFRSYLFPASLGILGFFDTGRVWYKNADGVDSSALDGKSDLWHRGFGGGVWFTPYNLAVVSAEAGHSKDGTLLYIRLGFLF
ncbi:BamA/TamA family outer membrane protein [Chryseosolibacter indicus]|uniref:BamA/TamA family outer membrane protein n=1 Tax=Chryseosolibacter indicus TaxID=2782351 RepID=A0ABS5VL52_9BACT|nr:BamA/TamA family outer membrane protein [Chryseosolibacter indicus]MBT1701723.1 BamA/TamA family outer membrane protein [Chryseosolibacter indicus]